MTKTTNEGAFFLEEIFDFDSGETCAIGPPAALLKYVTSESGNLRLKVLISHYLYFNSLAILKENHFNAYVDALSRLAWHKRTGIGAGLFISGFLASSDRDFVWFIEQYSRAFDSESFVELLLSAGGLDEVALISERFPDLASSLKARSAALQRSDLFLHCFVLARSNRMDRDMMKRLSRYTSLSAALRDWAIKSERGVQQHLEIGSLTRKEADLLVAFGKGLFGLAKRVDCDLAEVWHSFEPGRRLVQLLEEFLALVESSSFLIAGEAQCCPVRAVQRVSCPQCPQDTPTNSNFSKRK
jgi:hypothetical protein